MERRQGRVLFKGPGWIVKSRVWYNRRFKMFTIALSGSTTSSTARMGQVPSPILQLLHIQHRSEWDGATEHTASALGFSATMAWPLRSLALRMRRRRRFQPISCGQLPQTRKHLHRLLRELFDNCSQAALSVSHTQSASDPAVATCNHRNGPALLR